MAKLAQRLKRKPALLGLLVAAALGGFLIVRRGGGGAEEPDGEFGPAAPGTGIDDGGAGVGGSDGSLEVLSEIQLLADQLALDREEQLDALADLRESAGMAFGELATRLEELGYEDDGGYADDEYSDDEVVDEEPAPPRDLYGGVGAYDPLANYSGERIVLPPGVVAGAIGQAVREGKAPGARIVGAPTRPAAPKPKPKPPKKRPPKKRPPKPKPPKKRPPKKPPKRPPKRPPTRGGGGVPGTGKATVKGGGGSSTVKAM